MDSNEIDYENRKNESQYEFDEKEVIMDMYGDDDYKAEMDVDPLNMVLAAHDTEVLERLSRTELDVMYDDDETELVDEDNSNAYSFATNNPAFQLETTEV